MTRATEKAIATCKNIINQSTEKRKSCEHELILEARKPYAQTTNPNYANALMNTIKVETVVIK